MNAQTRLILFIFWFILLVIWEVFGPVIKNNTRRKERWTCNFLVILSGQILVRLLLTFGLFSIVEIATQKQFGLFYLLGLYDLKSQYLFFISLFILDFLIYLQHLISHRFKILWKFHRVHHMEDFLDVTSALRFHPFEIVFSMLYKVFWISLLGIPLEAFFIFEILLSSMAMFNHANIKLPKPVDLFMRVLLVTPDFHRVHHFAHNSFMHSNFGFNLSIWDYIFKTYKNGEDCPLEINEMGIPNEPKESHQFLWLLKSPFTYED